MAQNLDDWLSAVDHLLSDPLVERLDVAEVDRRIVNLRREIDSANFKIGVLRQLREKLADSKRRGPVRAAADARVEQELVVDEGVIRIVRLPNGVRIRELHKRDGSIRRLPPLPRAAGQSASSVGAGSPSAPGAATLSSPSRPVARERPAGAGASRGGTSTPMRLEPGAKRGAVLTLLKEDPDRQWSPSEVRDVLIARGLITDSDEGTPTRLLLRRMTESGDAERVSQGKYRLGSGQRAAQPIEPPEP